MTQRDTLHINTTHWTPLEVRVFNRRNEILTGVPLNYRASDTSFLEIGQHGSVKCRDDGIASITISAGEKTLAVPVRCWLVRRFGKPRATYLTVGEAPAQLAIDAYDAKGELMNDVRLTLVIADTSIVRLENGLVTGLRPGGTSISASSAGTEGSHLFWVESPQEKREVIQLRQQHH